MLSEALNGASNTNGYWLNASGKGYPKFHPRGVSVSPFNALFMALHSDKNGCGSNLFIHYNEAKAMGMSVREHERGVPFLFYNWNRYVNRNNPEEIISRTAYLGLDEQDRKHYKGVHNREVRTLFNIDQTTLQDVDRPSYEAALRQECPITKRTRMPSICPGSGISNTITIIYRKPFGRLSAPPVTSSVWHVKAW